MDITERKTAEMERARFFQLLPDLACIAGMDGYFKKVNPAFAQTLGYSDDELLKKPFIDFVHPDDRAATLTEGVEQLKGETTINFENRYICKDGSYKWFSWKAFAVFEEGLLYAVAHDVTEQKRKERGISFEIHELREIVESNTDTFYSVNLDGKLVKWNRALEKLTGLSRQALMLKPAVEFFHEEDRPLVAQRIRDVFEKGYGDVEARLIRGDGALVWFLCNGYLLRDLNGTVTGFAGTGRDISERKRKEKDISFEMHELRDIVESNTDFFYIHNTEGKIIKWNKALEKLTGLSPQELMLKPTLEFVCEEDRPLVLERMREVFEKGSSTVEARFISADGTLVPHLCNGYILKDMNGNVTGFAGTGRDITEIENMKQDLRSAKEKAENATRLKNNFISLVAHDLKSPLASLSMGLAALQSTKDLSPDSQHFIRMMANQSREMHKMTERLLDLSLLQAGRVIIQKQVINCRYFAASQIELYETMAAQKGITIINSLPEKMRVYADPDLFGECVKNVLSNALKFCNRGDTVTFFNPPDMPAAIAVKDTGPGIAPEKMPPLSTKGMVMRTIGTAGEKGTGIGLAHTKEIMEAHGGALTVESAAGGGSTFYLGLPVFDMVVLVVDDDEVSTFVLRRHLKDMGADVLTAKNGAEALEIIQGRPPILIITDITMPVMDGFALLQNLKTNAKHSHIPVIIITANNDIDTRKKAFANKAADFIIKPLSEPDFIPRINRFIPG